jgi:HD-GYP domain-containing protein (c-di-GMP phosphodiesterase class II)
MIADTLDAMTTDRPYRKALSLQKSLEEMAKLAGQQFDPKLVGIVTKSTSIRRLLGPELGKDVSQLRSQPPVSTRRVGAVTS